MKSLYLSKYTIVQIFKSNDFQKVYIATDNKDHKAVVINTIHIEANNSLWDSIEQNYTDIFHNVLHFERTENQIVFVTKVEEGLSLDGYLKDFSPSFTERVGLMHQYLSTIKKYDMLPNNIKSVLSDESQIIIDKGRLTFDELLIFDENSFNDENFSTVRNNIISILRKLTSMKSINYEDLSLYATVMGFLDGLQKNNKPYIHINDIFYDFKKLNIGSLPSIDSEKSILDMDQIPRDYNSSSFVGRKVSSINEEAIRMAEVKKSRAFTIAISTVGVATIAAAGLFAFKSVLPMNQELPKDLTVASEEIIVYEDEEVDHDHNVTDDDIDRAVLGPNSNIRHISEYIEQDFTTSKYGDYSFKISGDDSLSHTFSIEQSNIKPNSQLLMWVQFDSEDAIQITVSGYSDDVLSFQKSISHKPLFLNTWELVQLSIDTDIDDYVEIHFNDVTGTVWIDKVSINIFK